MPDWTKEHKKMIEAQRQFEQIIQSNRDAIMRQQEAALGELDPAGGLLATVADIAASLFGRKKK